MKKINIKDSYYIKEITYKQATELVIKHHYLHRKSSCSIAYGLHEKSTDEIIGVITYGKPASNSLCVGICGKDESKNVVELTRLWIKDDTLKNTESFFIGNTLKLLSYEIIVSYAEVRMGHLGIVYQATNWIYTGLSDKHVVWLVNGEEGSHSRHLLDEYGGVNNAKEALGEKLVKGERPRKHRYIFFNGSKKRKKELLNKLKYKIHTYPKNNETQSQWNERECQVYEILHGDRRDDFTEDEIEELNSI